MSPVGAALVRRTVLARCPRAVAVLLVLAGIALAPLPARCQDPAWSQITATQNVAAMGGRKFGPMVVDAGRNQIVQFGGETGVPAGPVSATTNEVWVCGLTHRRWARLTPAGTPPSPRGFHSAIYDPVGQRMIVFGGLTSTGPTGAALNEVWQLTLSGTPTWTQLGPSGPGPSPRWNVPVIYDPVQQRMVAFGGSLPGGGASTGEVWTLSLSGQLAWSLVTTTGAPPSARYSAQLVYDSFRHRVIVYGGAHLGTVYSDVRALDLATNTWSPISTATQPLPRYWGSAIYDPVGDRMVVFSGWTSTGANDTWQLTLAGTPDWSPIAISGASPPSRLGASSAYDPSGSFLVFGGSGSPDPLSDFQELKLSGTPQWSLQAALPYGYPIAPRRSHASAPRVASREAYLFGGTRKYTTQDQGVVVEYADDLYRMDLSAGAPDWFPLYPAGPAGSGPVPREGHRAVWDTQRDRMIVVGGKGTTFLNDVWALNVQPQLEWEPIVTTGIPPSPRSEFGLAYDPLRDRILMIGGTGASPYLGDAWQLPLGGPSAGTWSPLAVSGAGPSARMIWDMQYDPVRDRLVLFGGSAATGKMDDTWSLSLSGTPTWSQLQPPGNRPGARSGHVMVYAPQLDRMLLFGGASGAYYQDVWQLGLDFPIWTELTPGGPLPGIRDRANAVFDAAANRMVLYAGRSSATELHADTWALQFSTPVDVPQAASNRTLELAGAWPNPSSGDRMTVAFALSRRGAARVELLDVAGRRLVIREFGTLEPGVHRKSLGGPRLDPGLYVIRLAAEGRVVTAKALVVR